MCKAVGVVRVVNYICLFAGVPLLYMATISLPLGFLLNGTWHYGSTSGHMRACWLRYDTHFIWAFIAPVIVIIMTNVGFFVMALAIMCKHDSRNQDKRNKATAVRRWLKSVLTLTLVMGLTWTMGVLVFDDSLTALAFIFTIFIALQGLIIFILLVPLSEQVRKAFVSWTRDRVNSSSLLSSHFGDKLEKWMSKSRDTRDSAPKQGESNGFQPRYQLGTFDNSQELNVHVMENPTYDDCEWNSEKSKPVDSSQEEKPNKELQSSYDLYTEDKIEHDSVIYSHVV